MQSARLVWAEGEPKDVGRDMRSGGITGLHPTREGYPLHLGQHAALLAARCARRSGLPELAADERYDSVRKRAQHKARDRAAAARRRCRRAARSSGRHCSATRCLAPRRAASRTCSTIRRCSPRTWWPRFEHPTLGSYRGFTRPDQVRSHAGPGAVRRADAGPAHYASHGVARRPDRAMTPQYPNSSDSGAKAGSRAHSVPSSR